MRNFKITKSITNVDDISTKLYLKDINKIPLIDKEEEKELSEKIKSGDKKALDKLVVSNLRFVVSVAKQFRGQGLPFNDLIQEGTYGLIKAGNKFDGTKDIRFISYAVWWIRQAILDALIIKSNTIKITNGHNELLRQLRKQTDLFEKANGRKPSYGELSEITGISEESISKTFSYCVNCVSVDTPFDDEDKNSLIDIISNPNASNADSELIQESFKSEIRNVLNILPPRYKVIIQMFYGIDCDTLTTSQISSKFGITEERVGQLKNKALKILKSHIKLNNIL
jgi:RNA polymerase primary sigma factor